MKVSNLAVWLAAFALSLSGCAGRMPRSVTSATPVGLAVTGHGEASAAPDRATIAVGVEVRAASMVEARDRAAAAQTRLLAAVQAQGVASSDIQTATLTLQPEYDYSESGRRLLGYLAQNQVRVRVCDLTKLGATLDAAVDAAGDEARVSGVSFEIVDPAGIQAEARRRAVADARAKAEALAAQMGVRLGAPIAIEESGAGGPVPAPMMRMAAYDHAAPTPVSAGEIDTAVDVSVRWSIR